MRYCLPGLSQWHRASIKRLLDHNPINETQEIKRDSITARTESFSEASYRLASSIKKKYTKILTILLCKYYFFLF